MKRTILLGLPALPALPALLALLALLALTWLTPVALAAPRDLPERRMLVRDRDEGALPTVRIDWMLVPVRSRRGAKFRIPRFPLRRDLEVTLELERFQITRPDTRFVLGRKNAPDEPLDFDPSQVALFRGRVVGRPGSRVVLALRDGSHAGQINLGPGAPRFWISSRGERGRHLEPDRAAIFEAGGAAELPPGVPFCGVDGTANPLAPVPSGDDGGGGAGAPAPPAVGLAHLELAVDTDYEFFSLFGDASEAAAYLVALYAQVSDVYLRDVDTRVELVFARIWETPDDLFNEVDPSPLPMTTI